MKRFIFLLVAFTLVFSSALAFAKPKKTPPPNGEARMGTLYLFQKTSADGPWPIVQGGAWGMMRYNLWGEKFNFDFKGRGLQSGMSYTLIYYPDPWPGNGLICLGSGVANPGGNLSLHDFGLDIKTILGEESYGLPAEYDANYSPYTPSGAVGAKIWLVLSSDVICEGNSLPDSPQILPHMIGWNPDQYLFEYNLINFELR